jgi:5-methylcytosine-specific restriction endonuclease McrA
MFSFETASEKHIKQEKEKARQLRKSNWWVSKVQKEKKCYYCSNSLALKEATMDHIVPISRGGKTSKGNLAVCCKDCNSKKKYYTPIEWQYFLEKNNSEQ